MKPIAHKLFFRRRFCLCDFVFVVRKEQINAASMNINWLAKILYCHRRTLNMPSRAALAKGRLPKRFISFSRLPECKIARFVFCVFIIIHALLLYFHAGAML